MLARTLGPLCLVVLLTVSAHAQTTITFASNATWQTYAMNPDGSQGAALGPPQFPVWAAHGANLTLIPGAAWMWMPGVDVSSIADLAGAYFSKQFILAGTPVAGQILVAVDDFAEVIVNGSVVGSTGSISDHSAALTAQGTLVPFDITPYLITGINTITVKAQNGPYWFSGFGCNPCNYSPGGNPAGVVFGGTLSFDPVTAALRTSWGRVKTSYR